MVLKNLAIFLCLNTLLDIKAATFLQVQGTLILGMPSRDGFVIVADKRGYDPDTKAFKDTFKKIHVINLNAVFVMNGTVSFSSKTSAFDALQIVQTFLATNTFSD